MRKKEKLKQWSSPSRLVIVGRCLRESSYERVVISQSELFHLRLVSHRSFNDKGMSPGKGDGERNERRLPGIFGFVGCLVRSGTSSNSISAGEIYKAADAVLS